MPKRIENKYQLTLEEINNGITREQKLEKVILDLESELREAKEVKGLIFAILTMVKKMKEGK